MTTARSGSTRRACSSTCMPPTPVHAEIGDDDVEAPGLDAPQRLLPAPRRLDVVALLAEEPLQREHHRLLVVDDQDAPLHGSALRRQRQRHLDSVAAARLAPPRRSCPRAPRRSSFAIAMPRPVPFSLEVKKGLKMRSSLSAGMPQPLSRTADRRGAGAVVEEEVQARPSGTLASASMALSDHVHEHAAQLVGVGLHGRPGDVVARHGDLGGVELGAAAGSAPSPPRSPG